MIISSKRTVVLSFKKLRLKTYLISSLRQCIFELVLNKNFIYLSKDFFSDRFVATLQRSQKYKYTTYISGLQAKKYCTPKTTK